MCSHCKSTTKEIRYRVIANVCDGTHELNLPFWDDTCQSLQDKTAHSIYEHLEEQTRARAQDSNFKGNGIVKPIFPQEFGKFIGVEFLFKLLVQEKNFIKGNTVFVIKAISSDED